ncbi:hypothetical protein A3H38_00620 [candidate division WOR-1 bacterium RIFCSPLOWO2_02_FULL_46_20]|uniref:Polymerase/histidinol phosphatase N-terminal domain-containing protein n=2 Tax=Saganbacteria TaxID=1703751 RepID=A0A1F4RH21_UNCSA|nr:MAG: hypothetical protein A3H38_00620 [candidate division WOR-1 bacterium RIFCSPLOWO2_02_FULL_46_20]OGC07891.1 MAG: hypothetical protein A3F86_03105 [candidate division WOR-1 bacterium RIFCSPLOWO2_12_FULL_45_9]
MSADLHVHTTFSDGTQTPAEVISLAKQVGLTTVAITDHDVVNGIEPAKIKGQELGVEIIPGIELTSETKEAEVHILGYFIGINSPELLRVIKKIQNGRKDRIIAMCTRLQELGIDLKADKVFQLAANDAPGRPHVARALVDGGFVAGFKEAFDKYIEFHGPAYVPHYKLSPEEAIALVLKSGGLPVFGHPAVSNCDEIIPDLRAAGLVGIEAHYFTHSASQTEHYLKLAKDNGLLVTGGSDYHGFSSGREVRLGSVDVPDACVEDLKNEYIRRNKS